MFDLSCENCNHCCRHIAPGKCHTHIQWWGHCIRCYECSWSLVDLKVYACEKNLSHNYSEGWYNLLKRGSTIIVAVMKKTATAQNLMLDILMLHTLCYNLMNLLFCVSVSQRPWIMYYYVRVGLFLITSMREVSPPAFNTCNYRTLQSLYTVQVAQVSKRFVFYNT